MNWQGLMDAAMAPTSVNSEMTRLQTIMALQAAQNSAQEAYNRINAPLFKSMHIGEATAIIDALRWEIGMQAVEIDRLRAIIADQTAEPVKPVPVPPNPFREFSGDRRRVGA